MPRRGIHDDPQAPLRKMVRRLEAQNSIVLGWDVNHNLISNPREAYAWSQEYDIWFNSAKLPIPDNREDIMVVNGVNDHELGHIFFSPTERDIQTLFPGAVNEMLSALRTRGIYGHIWNILEDQRMETLLVKKFANRRPYLLAAFNRIVLEEGDQYIDTAYLLARGRRFIPLRVRKMLKRKFKRQDLIPAVRRIIDSYCKLNLFKPADLYKAHKLTVELVKLVTDNDLLPKNDQEEFVFTNHDTCQTLSKHGDFKNRTKEGTIDQEAVAKVVAAVAKDIDSETGKTDGQDHAVKAADSDADATDDGNPTPGQDQVTDAEDSPSDGDNSGGPEDGGGQSAGSGQGDGSVPSDQDVKDAVKTAIAVALDDVGGETDLREIERYIRFALDIDAPKVTEFVKPEDTMPMVAQRVTRELRKLESEVDPYWDRRTTSGRLNVQRVMQNPDDRDHAFDRWQEGGTAGNEQEWVVILDASSSMRAHFTALGQAAWVMKRAADMLRAKMTVLSFGNRDMVKLLWGPDEKAEANEVPLLGSQGGTEPVRALNEAHKVLTTSLRSEKGLLILTDGAWLAWREESKTYNGWNDPHDVIKDLNQQNVMTHLVYYGSGQYDKHHCQTHGQITKLDDLPVIMKGLIAGRIRKTR